MNAQQMGSTGVLTTTIDCDGVPVPVTTYQNPGESTADFIARHRQEVLDAIAECDGAQAFILSLEAAWSSSGQAYTLSAVGTWSPVAWGQLMDGIAATAAA